MGRARDTGTRKQESRKASKRGLKKQEERYGCEDAIVGDGMKRKRKKKEPLNRNFHRIVADSRLVS